MSKNVYLRKFFVLSVLHYMGCVSPNYATYATQADLPNKIDDNEQRDKTRNPSSKFLLSSPSPQRVNLDSIPGFASPLVIEKPSSRVSKQAQFQSQTKTNSGFIGHEVPQLPSGVRRNTKNIIEEMSKAQKVITELNHTQTQATTKEPQNKGGQRRRSALPSAKVTESSEEPLDEEVKEDSNSQEIKHSTKNKFLAQVALSEGKDPEKNNLIGYEYEGSKEHVVKNQPLYKLTNRYSDFRSFEEGYLRAIYSLAFLKAIPKDKDNEFFITGGAASWIYTLTSKDYPKDFDIVCMNTDIFGEYLTKLLKNNNVELKTSAINRYKYNCTIDCPIFISDKKIKDRTVSLNFDLIDYPQFLDRPGKGRANEKPDVKDFSEDEILKINIVALEKITIKDKSEYTERKKLINDLKTHEKNLINVAITNSYSVRLEKCAQSCLQVLELLNK